MFQMKGEKNMSIFDDLPEIKKPDLVRVVENTVSDPDVDFIRWKNETKENITYCSFYNGCFETDLIGVRVEDINDNDGKVYIIPLCRDYINKHGKEFYVKGDVIPLLVN
jgi:hypothetical protein